MIKGMQELDNVNKRLDNVNKRLDNENKQLRQEVSELKDMMQKFLSTKAAVSITGGYLSQNSPNPVNKSTVISFRIPEGSKSANIMITQVGSGKVIRTVPVGIGASQLTLETASLATGAYAYSLLIDGKKVDTKQMLIER